MLMLLGVKFIIRLILLPIVYLHLKSYKISVFKIEKKQEITCQLIYLSELSIQTGFQEIN